MNPAKPKKAKQKSLTHFHLAQGGRNFEEVHDISSLKLANLLSTMENLESLQLSSLLSTYDQGWDKFTVNYEKVLFDFKASERNTLRVVHDVYSCSGNYG